MSSHTYPVVGGGSPYWGDPVQAVGNLPASGTVGELRLVKDDDDLYEWNGSSWERITQNTADVTGQSSSVDSEVALFSGTSGKVIKRATGTGFVKVVSGVMQAPSATVALTSEVAETLPVGNGGTNSNAALNNNRVIKSAGGAIVEAAAITANRALASDANGIPVHSSVTDTELGHVSGVTGAIQTQLDAKLPKAGGTMTGDLVLAGDPDSALKAATKQYVDSVAAGLDVKPSVKCATTADITLSGEQTLDGVLTSASRVLVKNQAAPAENGIYLSGAGAWTRVADMDAWTEVPGGFVFVEQGTLYADTAWVCTANTGGTLGSTSITWSQFAGAGTYTADGQGIELTGTQYGLELDGATLAKSGSGLKVADGQIGNTQLGTGLTRSKLATGTAYRLVANDVGGAIGEAAAITASRALASDANGIPTHSATTATELGYVSGVTSAIQTQLNAINAGKGIVSVSSNVTLTDQRIHFVDTSSARSLTLPTPSATSFIVVKDKTGSCMTNNITIVRAASEKIETVAASYTLDNDLGSWTFVSDGTDWFII